MLPVSMRLDLEHQAYAWLVCYGNVSSKRHIYETSFDNSGQHIFLKTDARNQGHSDCLTVYVQPP